MPRPQTLRGYIRSLGGLHEPSGGLTGELRHLKECCAGLVNSRTGIPLDRAREAAAERGYLGPHIEMAVQNTTRQDLLDALHLPAVYSAFDLRAIRYDGLGNRIEEAPKRGGWRPRSGRPCIGKRPMTDAERQRKRYHKLKEQREIEAYEHEIPF